MRHWNPASDSFQLIYAGAPRMRPRTLGSVTLLSLGLWGGLIWLFA